MFKSKWLPNLISLVCLIYLVLISMTQSTNAQKWKQLSDLEKAGWSPEKLEKARRFATEIGSGSVLIIERGNIVSAWGHINHPYKSASIRKSVYDATFGATSLKKPFDPNITIKDLKIDDIEKLNEQEKSATFENLMTARSGIYHPAAYETPSNAELRPKRLSAKPGTFWYYNNWDFNITGLAFEKLSGMTIEDAFIRNLSEPLGMEDFKQQHIFRWLEPRLSRHPAVTFRLSARDLARIGKLYLRQGKWNNKQIISEKWIKRSTKPFTIFEEEHYRGAGNGYGRLWWIFPARPERNSSYQSYERIAALGAGGQIMVLIPEINTLIVHLADTDTGPGVNDDKVDELLDKILDARIKTKGSKDKSKLTEHIRIEKLSDKVPVPLRADYSLISEKKRSALEGIYMFTDKIGVRFYQSENRMFLQPIGMPLSDAEVFEVSDGSLRSPLVSLLVISEDISGNGKINEIKMSFRGREMVGKRKIKN